MKIISKFSSIVMFCVLLFVVACTAPEVLPLTIEETPREQSSSTMTEMPAEDSEKTTTLVFTSIPSVIITEEPQQQLKEEKSLIGQIAFVSRGDIWCYIFNNQTLVKITTGGNGGYQNLQISPEGSYLAYNKDKVINIYDFRYDKITQISGQGLFVNWAEESDTLFTVRENLSCDDIDELEDQIQINYDIFRINLNNTETNELITNISGGLKVPQMISGDGIWGSFLNCRCFSECSGHSLWHLPSDTEISHPELGLSGGEFSFSPDSEYVAFSFYQGMGYAPSPLFVSDINYTTTEILYNESDQAVEHPLWSSTGDIIAFNALRFDEEGMDLQSSWVTLIQADGSKWMTVGGNLSKVVTWSPDGGYLLYYQEDQSAEQYYIYNLTSGESILLPFVPEDYRLVDWGVLLENN